MIIYVKEKSQLRVAYDYMTSIAFEKNVQRTFKLDAKNSNLKNLSLEEHIK
jgi:hypothetical protein